MDLTGLLGRLIRDDVYKHLRFLKKVLHKYKISIKVGLLVEKRKKEVSK
jgi:hypothetical protein